MTVLAFYKGTCLQGNTSREQLKSIAKAGLQKARDEGESNNDIVRLLVGQLNVINDSLIAHYGETSVTTTATQEEFVTPVMAKLKETLSPVDIFTETNLINLWATNIAMLLELKVLRDDDKNGFLILPY